MSELITLKIHKTKKFSIIALKAVEDKNLTWKSKGLHTYLISRPRGWKIHYKELLRRSRDGKASLLSAIKNLTGEGYLRITKLKDSQGRWKGAVWEIFENKQPYPEKRDTEKPYTGNRDINNKQDNKNQFKKAEPALSEDQKKELVELTSQLILAGYDKSVVQKFIALNQEVPVAVMISTLYEIIRHRPQSLWRYGKTIIERKLREYNLERAVKENEKYKHEQVNFLSGVLD
jgi:hypothetical protein